MLNDLASHFDWLIVIAIALLAYKMLGSPLRFVVK
jgi:hypothetical protein